MKNKNKPDQQKPFIDLLRGRIPKFENPWLQIAVLLIIVAFWIFVVCKIGSWSLSIPAISNIVPSWIFKRGNSP